MPGGLFGTGFAVPDRVVTNDELAKLMDTSDGVDSHPHRNPGAPLGARRRDRSGLALAASQRALNAAGLKPTDIDAIIYATSTPDHFIPGGGVYLQRDLGAGPIPALDIRTQCSGFVYGLSVADAWIRSGQYSRVLLVGAEVQSTGMDVSTKGRNTAVIFADGAGAAILGSSNEEGRGVLGFDLHTDGASADLLWVDGPGSMYHPRVSHEHLDEGRYFLQMDGKEVFRHAVTRMPESVVAVLKKTGLSTSDIKVLIPHQANLRISEGVQKALKLRDDQVYNNIMYYGNTTAATIPIGLDECVKAGKVTPGDLIVLTAFGSGFMWGSAVVRW